MWQCEHHQALDDVRVQRCGVPRNIAAPARPHADTLEYTRAVPEELLLAKVSRGGNRVRQRENHQALDDVRVQRRGEPRDDAAPARPHALSDRNTRTEQGQGGAALTPIQQCADPICTT